VGFQKEKLAVDGTSDYSGSNKGGHENFTETEDKWNGWNIQRMI
jgi:hypothetical protein